MTDDSILFLMSTNKWPTTTLHQATHPLSAAFPSLIFLIICPKTYKNFELTRKKREKLTSSLSISEPFSSVKVSGFLKRNSDILTVKFPLFVTLNPSLLTNYPLIKCTDCRKKSRELIPVHFPVTFNLILDYGFVKSYL